MKSKISDSFLSDLTKVFRDYQEQSATSRELQDLVHVTGHFLDSVACVRRNQIMRSDARTLHHCLNSLDDETGTEASG